MMDMKINKVERIEQETGLMCLDDCIATVAGYYHCDYEMAYVGGFQVRGRTGMPNFAGQYTIRLQDRYENLKRYHGLQIRRHPFFSGRMAIRWIRRELKGGHPVLLLQNPYWCPWDDGYQKYDAYPGHTVIVTDVKDGALVCCDPYFEKENQRLSFELFHKGVQGLYRTRYVEPEEGECTPEKKRKALDAMYISLCEDGYFAGLRNFVQDARVCPDLFYDVFLDEDLWISSLVVFLMQTNQSIQNIAVVTDYVGRQCDSKERISAAESLWNLAVRWKQARKLIVKLYFIRREDERLKERTLTRLEDILTEMEKLAEKIPQIQEDEKETGGEKEDKVPEHGERKTVCVSLATHWNNRAFVREGHPEEGADFSSVGTCYVTSGEEREWTVDGMNFHLAELGKEPLDNVACDGQRIAIPRGKYQKIALIGAAEFGNSSDILQLQDDERM
ncbi:MAG: hypothetical protein J5988_11930, partial [Eubacterium sp.]|nr:hypothetical protein [Eubacterium sp.]